MDGLPPEKRPLNIEIYDDWPNGFHEGIAPDLIVSGLVLQSVNEIPWVIKQAKDNLEPEERLALEVKYSEVYRQGNVLKCDLFITLATIRLILFKKACCVSV